MRSKINSKSIDENSVFANLSRILPFRYSAVNQNDQDCIMGMFPRVFRQDCGTFSDIEMNLFNRNVLVDPEYLDNVIDKFVRVITTEVDDSKKFSVSWFLKKLSVNFSPFKCQKKILCADQGVLFFAETK